MISNTANTITHGTVGSGFDEQATKSFEEDRGLKNQV
jgi:hypothetical protein